MAAQPAPLAHRRIAITRAMRQAAPLAEGIRAAGGEALLFPLFAFRPISLIPPSVPLTDFSFAIFVSPMAVEFGLAFLREWQPWPTTLVAAAVGTATAQALTNQGCPNALVPPHGSGAEALLAHSELLPGSIKDKNILIIKGTSEGVADGSDVLERSLYARGARVMSLACYQRYCPQRDAAALLAPAQENKLDALTLTSSEGLRYLATLAGAEGLLLLQQLPLFVSHPLIEVEAQRQGWQQVHQTSSGDASMIKDLVKFFSTTL